MLLEFAPATVKVAWLCPPADGGSSRARQEVDEIRGKSRLGIDPASVSSSSVYRQCKKPHTHGIAKSSAKKSLELDDSNEGPVQLSWHYPNVGLHSPPSECRRYSLCDPRQEHNWKYEEEKVAAREDVIIIAGEKIPKGLSGVSPVVVQQFVMSTVRKSTGRDANEK